jgi:hypothetical protein
MMGQKMLSKASRYILVLTVVVITACANAQTSQPARMFNSTLKFEVYADVDRDGFISPKLLGKTPSDKPITIPHGATWWVASRNDAIKDVELHAICKELLDQDIPGLKLFRCIKITDAGLAHMKGLVKLEHLKLWISDKITAAELARMRGLKLKRLDLNNCEVTDAGLAYLTELTTLEVLGISYFYSITDAGLVHLKGLTKLERLKLRYCCNITDAGLAHLKGLTK